MLQRQIPGQRSRSSLLWLSLYGVAAIGFNCLYWLRCPGRDSRCTLKALTDFTAHTPFQYRILVPALARGIEWLAPLPLGRLYFVLSIVWTFVLLLAFARYLQIFVAPEAAAPAALFILYPMTFNYVLINTFYFPSDMASLVFFVWGLRLLLQGRMAWYYPVFILGTFNRETTCFLAVAMLLLEAGRWPGRRLALHLLAQSILWVGIKLLLGRWFSGNPGEGVFETHMRENLLFLAALFGRPDAFYGFHWSWSLRRWFIFGGIWALIPLGWKTTPAPARRLLWIVPLFFAGMMVVGVIHEMRIFGELIVILSVPALYGLGRWLGVPRGFAGYGNSLQTPAALDNK